MAKKRQTWTSHNLISLPPMQNGDSAEIIAFFFIIFLEHH